MTLLSNINDRIVFRFFLFLWIISLPFKNAVFQVSVLLLVFFLIYHIIKTKNFEILKDNLKQTFPLFIGFSLIIFAMLLSNLLNLEYLDKKSWHMIYMFLIRYGMIFIVLSYFYSLNYFKKNEIIIVIFTSFSLLGLTGIYEIFHDPNVLHGINGLKGSLDYRNAFGLFMGMAVVLSLFLMGNNKNLGLILILIFSFLMIFSFTRSSWVASVLSSLVFFLVNYKKIRLNHIIYLLAFLGFTLILYFSFDSFQERFKLLLEGNSSYRTTIWPHTMALIKIKLFFGYGLDTWMNLSDDYLKNFSDPHNLFLEILFSTGIFGLIASVYSISIILRKIYINKNFKLFSIATYFLVITQFDYGAFGSKELLSFLTIFVFFVYSDSFKLAK